VRERDAYFLKLTHTEATAHLLQKELSELRATADEHLRKNQALLIERSDLFQNSNAEKERIMALQQELSQLKSQL
jgi:regulator of replication initiation timing